MTVSDDNAKRQSLRLPATIDNLPHFQHYLSQFAHDANFPQDRIIEIELALEEIFTNICRYAYTDNSGEAEITCRLDKDDTIKIDVCDTGKPFNPSEAVRPQAPSDVMRCKLGEWGIFLLKHLADGINCRREGNHNILTITACTQRKAHAE